VSEECCDAVELTDLPAQVIVDDDCGTIVQVLAGAQGPPGPTGPDGPQGDPGIIIDAVPPLVTDVLWADTSEPGDMAIPPGGATGEVLAKVSGSDYDTDWFALGLDDLSDVDLTGVGAGDGLAYDGATFLPAKFAPLLLTETAVRNVNYTLALTDQGRVVPMNGASLTVTVPLNSAVAFPVGSVVNVYNLNASDVTIQGDMGVTVRNDGDLAQYGEVSLRKRGTDEWVVAGNLS